MSLDVISVLFSQSFTKCLHKKDLSYYTIAVADTFSYVACLVCLTVLQETLNIRPNGSLEIQFQVALPIILKKCKHNAHF